MSVKLMGRVWELDIPAQQQMLLLALADHADDDGMNCYPSIARLAWKINRSERTVQYMLYALEVQGIVKRTGLAGGRGKTTQYRLFLDAAPTKPPFYPRPVDPSEKGEGSTKGEETAPIPIQQTVKRASPIEEKGCNPRNEKGESYDRKRVKLAAPDPSVEIHQSVNRDRALGISAEDLDHCTDPTTFAPEAVAEAAAPARVTSKQAWLALWRSAFGRTPTAMQIAMLERWADAADRASLPGLVEACIQDCGERGANASYLRGMVEGCLTRKEFPGPAAASNRQNNRPGRVPPYRKGASDKKDRASSFYDDGLAEQENARQLARLGLESRPA